MKARGVLSLAWLLLLPATVGAAGGERQLGPASVYLSFRLQTGYEAFAEVRKLLPKRVQAGLPLLGVGLSRSLGFDPLGPAWTETAGVDAAAPAWASLYTVDAAAARARLGRIEQAMRKHLAGAKTGEYFRADEVKGALVWLQHRLVLKLSDAQKTRTFLGGLATAQGERAVLLLGKSKAEVAPRLASLLGLGAPQAEVLGAGLLAAQVGLLAKPERNLIAIYRVLEGTAVIDLFSEVMALPEKPDAELGRGLLAGLSLPKRPALDLAGKGLARRIFTDDAALGALVLARPYLALSAILDERDTLGLGWYGATTETFARRTKEAQACRKSFAPGAVPVGDLGLQLRGDRRGLHARLLWAAPAAVARAFTAATAKRDLIDPTEWQPKVVGLAGLGVELGPLLRALPRSGPFKLEAKKLEERRRSCARLAGGSLLLGGWVGLIGVLKAEAKQHEQLALLLEHGRNGVLLLNDLSTPSRPSVTAQVTVAQAGAAKLKESLGRLAHDFGRPETKTVAGRSTTIYPYLKAPLWGYSLAVADHKAEGLSLTLSSSRWDLPRFLEQTQPASRILPASILAFAHGQLGKIVTALSTDPQLRSMGKMLRDASQRLGEVGANLTLSEGVLVAEIRIALR